jgi:general secretion pathway protein L
MNKPHAPEAKPEPQSLLRLYLRANWPSQQTACEWALIGANGAPLQRGNSEPRHWPAATRCELILSADQCLPLNAHLPKAARARNAEVVGYALEEQLLGDIDAEHFTVGETNNEGQTAIWVIGRTRLHTLLAVLRPLQRAPQRLISELQLLPMPDNGWSVCLKAHGGFTRTATEAGFSFDRPPPAPPGDTRQAPLELQLALQAAGSSQTRPARLDIHTEPGVSFDTAQARAWQEQLGIPVRHVGDFLWHDAPGLAARNLLSGDFAPPRARGEGWSRLRPAALIAALGLTLYSLFSFGEWARLEHQKTQIRQQMTERFRAAFPQAQTIVDPALQMQRLYDQLRRERGQLGSSDFLPLLAAVTENTAEPGTLRQIAFDDGRLELTLRLPDARAAERLRDTLTRRGLGVTLRDSHPANSGVGVETVFAVRGTP